MKGVKVVAIADRGLVLVVEDLPDFESWLGGRLNQRQQEMFMGHAWPASPGRMLAEGVIEDLLGLEKLPATPRAKGGA